MKMNLNSEYLENTGTVELQETLNHSIYNNTTSIVLRGIV